MGLKNSKLNLLEHMNNPENNPTNYTWKHGCVGYRGKRLTNAEMIALAQSFAKNFETLFENRGELQYLKILTAYLQYLHTLVWYIGEKVFHLNMEDNLLWGRRWISIVSINACVMECPITSFYLCSGKQFNFKMYLPMEKSLLQMFWYNFTDIELARERVWNLNVCISLLKTLFGMRLNIQTFAIAAKRNGIPQDVIRSIIKFMYDNAITLHDTVAPPNVLKSFFNHCNCDG